VSFALPAPCYGAAAAPYQACEIGCPPDEGCDLFATGTDPTGCPAGLTCVMDAPLSDGGCDVRMCIPEGTVEEGDDCSGGDPGCRRGMGCYGNSTEGFYCLSYCDVAHPCTVGTCTALGSVTMPSLGICLT
jgi:hypothetical protein